MAHYPDNDYPPTGKALTAAEKKRLRELGVDLGKKAAKHMDRAAKKALGVERPNRFGEDGQIVGGVPVCKHRTPLWRNCQRCEQLLEKLEHPDGERVFPNLIGTGSVPEW